MSNTKKTIQINPELFKIPGSSKTRKNREKKELKLTPIISPNNLKNKLLKRIKEHKTKETSSINNKSVNSNNTNSSSNSATSSNNKTNDNSYSDEFYGAMNYLSDLSKKQKNEREREKHKSNLHNKTIKSNSNVPTLSNISLELPPELQEPTPIKSSYFTTNVNSDPVLTMNYNSNNISNNSNNILNTNSVSTSDVPYGCLKNGSKPTYRDWIKTRKNHEYPEPNVRPPTPPKRNTFVETQTTTMTPVNSILSTPVTTASTTLSREKRLEQIKQKLKKIQDQEIKSSPEATKLNNNLKILEGLTPESEKKIQLDILPEIDDIKSNTLDVTQIIEQKKEIEAVNNPKQYLKKTVHRKFTLGKSDKLRQVGILLKDKKTRKNVMDVQHELKKTSITDVRKYLRQHGIIKIGSNAPNDILRKTFESAMLAGEITNTNKETILHNFMNEDTSSTSSIS
jgi:hypothetical protein